MVLENIYGKILALLREIKLVKAMGEELFQSNFMVANDPERLNSFGNIGLEWWYTRKGYKICDDLAKMIIAQNILLSEGDYESFSNIIRDTIERNGLNKELFKTDVVFNSQVENLLDARNISDHKVFAARLYEFIEKQLTIALSDWMILVPVMTIISDSYYFKSLNIHLLSSEDIGYWQCVNSDYKSSSGFNPSDGKNFNSSIIPAAYKVPANWIIFKTTGTEVGAIKKMEFLIRELTVLIYALKVSSSCELNNLIENKNPRYCFIFPKYEDKVGFNLQINSLPFLEPPFSVATKIDLNDLKIIEEYIQSIKKLKPQYQKRFETATQFIHYGMLAYSNVEKFMHFYIALDAMYGEIYNVEESIKNGLLSIENVDKDIKVKSKKLYDLRNEILHGGCSRLEEWKGYSKYLDEFDIEPFEDLELICYRCIMNYYKYAKEI